MGKPSLLQESHLMVYPHIIWLHLQIWWLWNRTFFSLWDIVNNLSWVFCIRLVNTLYSQLCWLIDSSNLCPQIYFLFLKVVGIGIDVAVQITREGVSNRSSIKDVLRFQIWKLGPFLGRRVGGPVSEFVDTSSLWFHVFWRGTAFFISTCLDNSLSNEVILLSAFDLAPKLYLRDFLFIY